LRCSLGFLCHCTMSLPRSQIMKSIASNELVYIQWFMSR
jgi:hypothetical protein